MSSASLCLWVSLPRSSTSACATAMQKPARSSWTTRARPPFRDTGNCVERYATVFEQQGVERAVRVDTCQAFWQVSTAFWHERDADPTCQHGTTSSFWTRLDVDETGTPNGRFTLPWHSDPGYHYHYEHFRNVSFAAVKPFDDRYAAFALVQGRGGGTEPVDRRPEARHLFGLLQGLWRWEQLPDDSAYVPPAPFFAEFEGQFLDLDGDGDDDAVDARGPQRVAYLNELDEADPGWRERSDYVLPRECDFGNGHCQAVDLDGDEDLDLLLDNGRTVYLNRSRELGADARLRMTSATVTEGASGVSLPRA